MRIQTALHGARIAKFTVIIPSVVFVTIAVGAVYGGPSKRRAEVPEGAVVMGRGKEIFANSEAAETVREARRYDPMTAERDMKDRNKAIALYEKAIALQPGAPINVKLAVRIGEMYATTPDPDRGVKTDPVKAAEWARRCIEWTDKRQILWGEAHMLLGCSSFLGKGETSAQAFKKILEMDPEAMELPPWEAFYPLDTPYGIKQRREELERIRKNVRELKRKAVEMVEYVSVRDKRLDVRRELGEIGARHDGTEAGWKAQQLKRERELRPDEDDVDSPTLPAWDESRELALVLIPDLRARAWTWWAIAGAALAVSVLLFVIHRVRQ